MCSLGAAALMAVSNSVAMGMVSAVVVFCAVTWIDPLRTWPRPTFSHLGR